jgi:L-threonylcarbamoyladenylate synthase
MPQELRWPPPDRFADEAGAIIETCRASLLRGELVALPTEAGYLVAANALDADAVARLVTLRSGASAPLPMIAVRGAEDVRDWVANVGPLGRRLARRCWPGPVVLLFADGAMAGAASRLPEGVLRTIAPDFELGLTCPHYLAVRALVELMPEPLVLAELSGEPTTLDAIATVVDDGPPQFDRPTTVVEIRDDRWTIRREGVITAAELTRLSAQLILFICTGNTCRSPLAAALCKKRLADRLECSADDLPGRGFVVESAGLAALRGQPAAVEAVEVARELGADLSVHASRPATGDLLADADLIVGMTAGHLFGLEEAIGETAHLRLLCGDADLADPIGGDLTVYQGCAGTIWQNLQGLIEELVAPGRG